MCRKCCHEKGQEKKTCLIIEWNIHNFSYLSAQCVPNMFLRCTKGTHIIALFFFFFEESKTNANIILVFEYFNSLQLNKITPFLFQFSLLGLPSTQPLCKEVHLKVNPARPWEKFCYYTIVVNHKWLLAPAFSAVNHGFLVFQSG